ncbi:hypothetical protein C1646_775067 [Rhizophagus diaphanus]|nr:hypothetical protein C1646_775067 [Rhizophagus diaphanus] [Rhizophagus sp. MUCL 43196]
MLERKFLKYLYCLIIKIRPNLNSNFDQHYTATISKKILMVKFNEHTFKNNNILNTHLTNKHNLKLISLSSRRSVEGNWHLAISNVINSIINISTLIIFYITSASEFICSTCQKRYKKQDELLQHLKQQTYVVLFNDLPEHLKNNPLAIATHATESIATYRCKSRYNFGEVIIKWKIKGKKNAKEN